jgi:hypothetical protein
LSVFDLGTDVQDPFDRPVPAANRLEHQVQPRVAVRTVGVGEPRWCPTHRPWLPGAVHPIEGFVVLTGLGPRYDPARARAAVRRLRERWPNAPIMLLTSHRAATEESDQLGADALILKPFDVDDLSTAAGLLIARSRARELEHRLH